ncbi:MAG TPA: hypothetical protein VJL81_11195 [Solirubrobacterales bacterium]|nr:hypothetical protein [Solirubrobacterales bacterium]
MLIDEVLLNSALALPEGRELTEMIEADGVTDPEEIRRVAASCIFWGEPPANGYRRGTAHPTAAQAALWGRSQYLTRRAWIADKPAREKREREKREHVERSNYSETNSIRDFGQAVDAAMSRCGYVRRDIEKRREVEGKAPLSSGELDTALRNLVAAAWDLFARRGTYGGWQYVAPWQVINQVLRDCYRGRVEREGPGVEPPELLPAYP